MPKPIAAKQRGSYLLQIKNGRVKRLADRRHKVERQVEEEEVALKGFGDRLANQEESCGEKEWLTALKAE